jgi:hypothetical protein
MRRSWTAPAIAVLAVGTLLPAASAMEATGKFDPTPVVTMSGFGELKVRGPMMMPGTSLYVDGTFVGFTNRLREVPIKAGTHNVELVDPKGRVFFRETVNVEPSRTSYIVPGHRRMSEPTYPVYQPDIFYED